jgi:SAM-dependent methyltransferase
VSGERRVSSGAQHWESIYADADPERLGWYEPEPATLPLVIAHSTPADSVIDVGGGASRLAEHLLDCGYRDLTVLDTSVGALGHARDRLGERGEIPVWLHADVLDFVPTRRWQVWHDRAVFHFLVADDDRAAYRRTAVASIEPGGMLIVATFAPDGPEMCAGLPVRRYDEASLAAEFMPGFDLVEDRRLGPVGDVGDQRPYVAVCLRRR